MAISRDEFRQVMGCFATGVTIVTSRHEDYVHGTTVSAFCSVSLEPPLVLVCMDHASECHPVIAASGVFGVNMMPLDQQERALTMARKSTPEEQAAHRLEGVPYRVGATGAPILEGCLAYADCRVVAAHEAGDHTIFVGEVIEAGSPGDVDAPLLYYRGRFGGLAS